MRRIFLTMAAISAMAAAAPAAAQVRGYGSYGYGYGYSDTMVQRQLDQLRRQIDAGVRNGGISRSEAVRLQDELYDIDRLQSRYGRSGLSVAERSDLQSRLIRLRDRIAAAEGGRGYGSGYGYDYDRGYPGGTYPGGSLDPYDSDVYDRNDDGWDDRGYDPYPDDRYDDTRNGGTYDPYRPGYDGTYDTNPYDNDDRYDGGTYDPSDDDTPYSYDDGVGVSTGAGASLRVGDRAPGNLSAVPPEYRSRYVDGNGVYYRYDNGRVYQIDQRSGTIRWVGDLPY